MRRGEIWLINLDPTIGAEIKKTRPAVIVNDDAVGIRELKIIHRLIQSNLAMIMEAWDEHCQ